MLPGTDGILTTHITCYNRNKMGHYASQCPSANFQGMQCIGCDFNQSEATQLQDILGNNSILIDSGSTFNLFNDETLLFDIDACDPMRAYSNGGHMDYEEQGPVCMFPAVMAYFNAHSLANILALSCVTDYYRVTMDSRDNDRITVHVNADEAYHFTNCGFGLYSLDPDTDPIAFSPSTTIPSEPTIVDTVASPVETPVTPPFPLTHFFQQ